MIVYFLVMNSKTCITLRCFSQRHQSDTIKSNYIVRSNRIYHLIYSEAYSENALSKEGSVYPPVFEINPQTIRYEGKNDENHRLLGYNLLCMTQKRCNNS